MAEIFRLFQGGKAIKKFGYFLDRAADRLSSYAMYVGGISTIALGFYVTASGVGRTVGIPIRHADEIGGYFMVLLSLWSAAYCFQRRGHLRVEFFQRFFGKRLLSALEIALLLVALAVTAIMFIGGYTVTLSAFSRGAVSNTALAAPLYLPMVVIPIGWLLLGLSLIAELVRTIRRVVSPS